jgi:hypothetical protein
VAYSDYDGVVQRSRGRSECGFSLR